MAGKSSEEVEQKQTESTETSQGQTQAYAAGEQATAAAAAAAAAAAVDPECLIKHPLQHTWTLWYLEPDRSKTWEESLNEVTSFSTVEDFWSLYNHIRCPSEIKTGGDYSLFKSGIRPMWEDEANKRGGKWVINLNKNQRGDLDKYWLDTILCLIGEAFENSDEICGAVVNVRQKIDKISIWTANSQNRESVMDVGRIYKERLGVRVNLTYQSHKDAMARSGSSAKSTYTL